MPVQDPRGRSIFGGSRVQTLYAASATLSDGNLVHSRKMHNYYGRPD